METFFSQKIRGPEATPNSPRKRVPLSVSIRVYPWPFFQSQLFKKFCIPSNSTPINALAYLPPLRCTPTRSPPPYPCLVSGSRVHPRGPPQLFYENSYERKNRHSRNPPRSHTRPLRGKNPPTQGPKNTICSPRSPLFFIAGRISPPRAPFFPSPPPRPAPVPQTL